MALAAAVTSWTEFSDAARKTERYTRAVIELENLLSKWKSLSDVEKSSTTSISSLIHTAESIIADERVAWVSTANQDKSDGKEGKEGSDGGDGEGGKKDKSSKEGADSLSA